MATETLWLLSTLLVLFSAHDAHFHKGSRGLLCVNDFVHNVSCTWNSTTVAPGADCWIHGTKKNYEWIPENQTRQSRLITRSCKLKQHGSAPPGCSFAFENEEFTFFEVSNISVHCDGKLMENLIKYKLRNHIKMNPPDVPAVNSTANDTWITWGPGSPRSDLLKSFDFQVQIKLKQQTWKEVRTLSTQEQQLRIPTLQLQGNRQVRVRVRPSDKHNNHWSDWSPTTSWTGAADKPSSQDQVSDWLLQPTSLVMWGVMLSVGLIAAVLVVYMSCVNRRRIKVKPVPNPSKYFPTLHSTQGGNLKKWLNPLSASDLFFMAQPCENISPVEVCETWGAVPSTSPSSSSTTAQLHSRTYPPAVSDANGVLDNSFSSSCFSNLDNFASGSTCSVARTDPRPAYFSYQDDCQSLRSGHKLHLTLCPSLTSSSAYENLKREPQSPDSGFSITEEDEEDKEEEEESMEDSDDHQRFPLLILPLRPPSQVRPPSPSPPSPHLPSLAQKYSESQEVYDGPEVDACVSYAAWPVAGTMSRSSSMPTEPCKTGYLTLKELQSTFSNKSI